LFGHRLHKHIVLLSLPLGTSTNRIAPCGPFKNILLPIIWKGDQEDFGKVINYSLFKVTARILIAWQAKPANRIFIRYIGQLSITWRRR